MSAPNSSAPPDELAIEVQLEALRRSSGLRMDKDGAFWHEGRELTHARIVAALHAGIDRHPTSGEYIVRIGREWAYVEVEDAPLVVRGMELHEETRLLRLSDGSTEPLDPAALSLGDGDVLYTRARAGTLFARFSRVAFLMLAPAFELDPLGRAHLHHGGALHKIARRESTTS